MALDRPQVVSGGDLPINVHLCSIVANMQHYNISGANTEQTMVTVADTVAQQENIAALQQMLQRSSQQGKKTTQWAQHCCHITVLFWA